MLRWVVPWDGRTGKETSLGGKGSIPKMGFSSSTGWVSESSLSGAGWPRPFSHGTLTLPASHILLKPPSHGFLTAHLLLCFHPKLWWVPQRQGFTSHLCSYPSVQNNAWHTADSNVCWECMHRTSIIQWIPKMNLRIFQRQICSLPGFLTRGLGHL